MSSEEDLLRGAQDIQVSELDEKALLGDDFEAKVKEEEDDLFDAAIEPTGQTDKSTPTTPNVESKPVPTAAVVPKVSTPTASTSSYSSSRRWHCYIGNMTWWTTDEDLMKTLSDYGVKDVVDVRFGENRQNGQSRGFASVATASEQSIKVIMDRVPGRQLHGQLLTVLPFSKQSLAKLEEATKKPEFEKKEEKSPGVHNMGTIRIGPPPTAMNRVGLNGINPAPTSLMSMGFNPPPQNLMTMRPQAPIQPLIQQQPLTAPPPQMAPTNLMSAMISRPPPNFQQGIPPVMGAPHSNVNTAQALNSALRSRQAPASSQPNMLIPPGTHVNPQVYPYFAQNQQKDSQQACSADEYKEIMNRNRTVSSSAIARAMSDATAGDVDAAVETLMTAMALIRQSKVASDEACKGLLQTLQEALNSVEKQGSSTRKHHRRSRSPSDRRSKRHRRSRSRSRSPRYSSRRH